MAGKLPVFATVKTSYGCLRRYGLRMLPYLIALVVVKGASLVGKMLIIAGMAIMMKLSPGDVEAMRVLSTVVGILAFLAIMSVLTPIQTSMQRLVVSGETARVGLGYGDEEWLTVRAYFKVFGFIAAATLPVGGVIFLVVFIYKWMISSVIPEYVIFSVFILLFFFFLYWVIKLYPVLPAAALGERVTLRESRQLVKGQFWRLLGVGICITLPFSILVKIVTKLCGDGLVGELVASPVWAVATVLQAASYALVYQHLKAWRAASEDLPPLGEDSPILIPTD